MICLCCGKPIKNDTENGWHKACINNFFGTSEIPEIEINDSILEKIATESTSKGLTVPGVQKKISLNLHSNGKKSRLTLVNHPTGYILKPQVEQFECLPESEQLVMSMADSTGISTVPHALVKCGNNYAYITKRIDRIFDRAEIKMLAMEDFCQLDLRLTADKYKGSYERCSKLIKKYSSQVGLDMSEFFMRLVFSYVVGNSDMHLKNFSLIETNMASGAYILSPAYDLLPVSIILPEDKEEFALTFNGKKQHIRKKDFFIFAEACDISKKSAEKMLAKVLSMKDKYVNMCEESLLSEDMKVRFIELIERRCRVLE